METETYRNFALATAAATGVLLVFLGLVLSLQRRRASAERLQSYLSPVSASSPRDQALTGVMADVDHWMNRQKMGASIARDLAQADLKLTVTEYMLVHAGLLAVGLVVGAMLLGSAAGGIIIGCALLLVPRLYVANAKSKRRSAFAAQLPAALSSLSNSLRGGYGLVQAMQLVANEMSSPMSVEFQRVVSEVSYGLPYDTAFKNMLRRNPTSDLGMVVTAIEINLEMGGNLAEILDNIGAIIRDRVRIQSQVKAYTSQVRLSSYLLTGLPFLLAGIIYLLNPSYMSQLWSSTTGLLMLGAAVVFLATGTVILRKISQIDV